RSRALRRRLTDADTPHWAGDESLRAVGVDRARAVRYQKPVLHPLGARPVAPRIPDERFAVPFLPSRFGRAVGKYSRRTTPVLTMTFLPIVDRELRVSARQRNTRRVRVVTVALVMGVWLFLSL